MVSICNGERVCPETIDEMLANVSVVTVSLSPLQCVQIIQALNAQGQLLRIQRMTQFRDAKELTAQCQVRIAICGEMLKAMGLALP